MKTATNKSTARLIMGFIIARHCGDVREAKRVQGILRKRLGARFTKTMLLHGDPDRDGYMTVLKRWEGVAYGEG